MHSQGFEGFKPWYFLKGVYFWLKMTFLTKNRKQIDLDTTHSIKQIKDWSMKYYLLWKPNLRKSGKIGENSYFVISLFWKYLFWRIFWFQRNNVYLIYYYWIENRVKFRQCLLLLKPTMSKIRFLCLEICSLGSKGSLKDNRHFVTEHIFTLV